MTFEIEIGGRSRSVSIERVGARADAYRITVDGRQHLVEARRAGEFSLLVRHAAAVSAGAADKGAVPLSEILVAPATARGELLVTLGGRTVAATVNGRRTGRGSADAGSHAHGEQTVLAPMPGRVVRVLVNAGDEVTARQGVVVVEAMKMENELRSPKAGRVKDVQVSAGASVEAGKVLVVIE